MGMLRKSINFQVKINDGRQNQKYLQKQTLTSSPPNIILNQPILSEKEANMVRNRVLKYIPLELSLSRAILNIQPS